MTIRSRTRLSPLARRGTRCATVGDWHSPAAKEKGNCLPLLSQRSPSTPPQSALPPAHPQGEALRYRYSGFVPLANVFVCTTFRQSFSYFPSFPAPVSGAFLLLFPVSKIQFHFVCGAIAVQTVSLLQLPRNREPGRLPSKGKEVTARAGLIHAATGPNTYT